MTKFVSLANSTTLSAMLSTCTTTSAHPTASPSSTAVLRTSRMSWSVSTSAASAVSNLACTRDSRDSSQSSGEYGLKSPWSECCLSLQPKSLTTTL